MIGRVALVASMVLASCTGSLGSRLDAGHRPDANVRTDSGSVPDSATSDAASDAATFDSTTAPDDATTADASTTCGVEVTPNSGSDSSVFAVRTDSNGMLCRWLLDGMDQGVLSCRADPATMIGAGLTPGLHEVVLAIDDGPGGTARCTAAFMVESSIPAGCVTSSLMNLAAVTGAGFTRRGGVFRDGGWAVEASCDQLTQRLTGTWDRGYLEFEARDLLRIIPYDAASHGCERFIFNLNFGENRLPDHTRVVFANMASDCAGRPRGNLRAILFDSACCVDGPRLPSVSDGGWHDVRVEWTGSRIFYSVDGVEQASQGYSGLTPGNDILLTFGSECASGDETGAVFRNLTACPLP